MNSTTVSVSLPQGLVEKIRKKKREKGASLSAQIRLALENESGLNG